MMKFSMNTIIFRDTPVKDVLSLMKENGYDGVEIAWVPKGHPFYWGKDVDVSEVRDISKSLELEVCSICPFWPAKYDLANVSNEVRKNAISYLKNTIDAADELGAKVIVVVPSAVFKEPSGSFEMEWKSCVGSLKEVGSYAAGKNVVLAIEPLIRFLSYFINRMDQGLELIRSTGSEGLGVMADVFHMNVEEKTIEGAIEKARDKLVHVHVSDSNNMVPGSGHLNFKSIFRTLKSISYDGFISGELGVDKGEAPKATREMIEYLRNIEREM